MNSHDSTPLVFGSSVGLPGSSVGLPGGFSGICPTAWKFDHLMFALCVPESICVCVLCHRIPIAPFLIVLVSGLPGGGAHSTL